MTKANQNKQKTNSTFAELVADSELETETIQIGDHEVTIRELTGRERYELSTLDDTKRWDTMLWLAHTGLVEPKPETVLEMEQIRTGWIALIANAILKISGMEPDAVDDAENESASVTDIGGS